MTERKKPVIFAVIPDSLVLRWLEDKLNRRYSEQYQVITAGARAAAQDLFIRCQLEDRSAALAILGCCGDDSFLSELVEKASVTFPGIRRVFIGAFDDRDSMLDSLRRQVIDSYLTTPLDNPETELYPIVDSLLADWKTNGQTAHAGIRIVGYRWSARGHRLKTFLARNLIPYRWLELEQSQEAHSLLQAAGINERHYPIVFLPDGSYMVQPQIPHLAERVGLQNQAESRFYDLVVVGGGPAGLSAAVYGASEGLDTLLIEAEAPGGQAGESSRIENYLGFPNGLSGAELARRAVAQAIRFGVEILTPQEATRVRMKGHYRVIELANGSEVACHVMLVATGVTYRRLNVPGEERLTGRGVYYGTVVSEAFNCEDQEVFILGGGNSAGQAAMYVSRFAREVTVVTNEDSLAQTMSHYLIDQIHQAENIRVRYDSTIAEMHGEGNLEAVTLRNEKTGTLEKHQAAAVFIYIGMSPRTDWLKEGLACDDQGYILTGPDVIHSGKMEHFQTLGREPYFLESSIPGIFVAGDTRHGSVKRIASGVGEGAMAVTLIHQYLLGL